MIPYPAYLALTLTAVAAIVTTALPALSSPPPPAVVIYQVYTGPDDGMDFREQDDLRRAQADRDCVDEPN